MVATMTMPRRTSVPAQRLQERRVFPRKEFHVDVQALRMDHSIPALRQPSVTLALRDLSLGGLSAISSTPLLQGERVSVQFPQKGTIGGWDVIGRVLRCSPSALGYRVALEFDPLPAA